MIQIRVGKQKITVVGRAGYAPIGQDIVCAAITAITLTLIIGLRQIAEMDVKSRESPGNVCIEWQHMNDTGKALIDTWFLGISAIAGSHNCIQFI